MFKPQQMKIKLADKEVYNDKFVKYVFEMVDPHIFEFEAGQYVTLVVDENGDRRSYSIASTPENKHGFELLIDNTPQGIGTKFLESLEFGTEILAMGPIGRFTFFENGNEDELVFVATGSGIAPMRSMIFELLQDKSEARPMTLYWGLRYVENMFWQNDFQDLSEQFSNFHFHPVISKAVEEWPLCKGRVTDCLSVHEISQNAAYYLCGNTQMIEEVNHLLQSKQVKPENIHFEKFF